MRYVGSGRFTYVAALTAVLAAAFSPATQGAQPSAPAIKPSPAFSPAQLQAAPTTGWLTNGGNLFNQRFSPLTQLDLVTVKDLKAVWRASLRGSGSTR